MRDNAELSIRDALNVCRVPLAAFGWSSVVAKMSPIHAIGGLLAVLLW